MGKWVLTFVFLGLATTVSAQSVAFSTSKLAWDQEANSVEEAQQFVYKLYPDGAEGNLILGNVVCSGTSSPFTCIVPFPGFTPGAHSLELTAGNGAGESLKSTPFPFLYDVVVPSPPRSIRIIK